MLLPDAEPKVLKAPLPDEVVVTAPTVTAPVVTAPTVTAPVVTAPDESITCMFDLDCLMRQIEAAAGVPVAFGPPAGDRTAAASDSTGRPTDRHDSLSLAASR
jgi:hypothetical protein